MENVKTHFFVLLVRVLFGEKTSKFDKGLSERGSPSSFQLNGVAVLSLLFFFHFFFFTCLRPGTSVTGLPSALIHRISGRGLPVAAHSTTVPVVLEKSIRLAGSFRKTGPDSDEELAAAVAEPSLHSHGPIIHQTHENEIIIIIIVSTSPSPIAITQTLTR